MVNTAFLSFTLLIYYQLYRIPSDVITIVATEKLTGELTIIFSVNTSAYVCEIIYKIHTPTFMLL